MSSDEFARQLRVLKGQLTAAGDQAWKGAEVLEKQIRALKESGGVPRCEEERILVVSCLNLVLGQIQVHKTEALLGEA